MKQRDLLKEILLSRLITAAAAAYLDLVVVCFKT